MATLVGQTVSHYEILEHLGGGGMGVVYKARDLKLDRPVALKFLPPELTRDPEAKERFVLEAKAASTLQHNNICTVHDIDETPDGQLFIVMDFYEGETVKKKIERGPLKIEEAIGIAVQVAQGLAKAHEQGIVHRDIKPANIVLTKDGVAKIVDFGLAKLTGRTMLTRTGSTLGTAAYMSPEQARGEAADQTTDLWSLGATLYEMLTGHKPFESDYEQALVYSILNEEPRPFSQFRVSVPDALEKICRRAMAKHQADRYQSAPEMIEDLDLYTAGSRVSDRTRRLSFRKRMWSYVGVAVLAVILALVGLFSPLSHTQVADTIAVLPIANTSRNPDLEYICDGLTEAILDDLCKVSGLKKVIALTSVMKYKNQEIVPSKVSKELDVAALVISRLYQHGDELTVSVELVGGRDEKRIWGAQYSRSYSQLGLIHKDVSSAVAGALRLAGPEGNASAAPQQSTSNPEAYRAYLLGQHFYHKLDEGDLHKAIECYRRALQLDPRFAKAYAGLSDAYFQIASVGSVPWNEVADSVRLNALQALSLDGNLAEAHAAISSVRYNNYEREAAEQEMRTAMGLNPLAADIVHNYAHLLSEDGRHDEAIRIMRKSTELEPLSAHYQYCLATVYKSARRWDDAVREYQKVMELDSTYYRSDAQIATVYFFTGEYDRATELMQQCVLVEKKPARLELLRAKIYAVTRRDREARAQLDRLYRNLSGEPPDPAEIAAVHSLLGDKDSAMVWLEKSYQERSNQFFYAKVKPEFDSLRGDPRFSQFLAKSGFTP